MLINSLEKGAKIHFIGIGGVSMSGLAHIALEMGYCISGSDINDGEMTKRLKNEGIEIFIGCDPQNVHGKDLVVYTAAIKKDNLELVEANKLNIHTMERSEFLGELTKLYSDTIGICGTHGKTTTTSMVSLSFIEAGLDPSIQVGANLKQINGNYRVGKSNHFIIESCEYVESFLKFHPKAVVLLNIEEDHLDYFKDINHIKSAFKKFVELVPNDGVVVYNKDDDKCQEVIKNLNCKTVSFSINDSSADWIATNIRLNPTGFYSYTATNGYKSIDIDLNVVGYHNIMNSLATVAISDYYGISEEAIKNSLRDFTGAERRFEYRGMINGARVFDDYAHHPTEIMATINSAKALPHNKIWAIFQPHTYSRTKTLWDEFVKAFKEVDNLLLLDIYAAREKFDGETTSEKLADAINDYSQNCMYISSFESCIEYLKENVKENDVVLTIGAGNVTSISHELVK